MIRPSQPCSFSRCAAIPLESAVRAAQSCDLRAAKYCETVSVGEAGPAGSARRQAATASAIATLTGIVQAFTYDSDQSQPLHQTLEASSSVHDVNSSSHQKLAMAWPLRTQ